MGLDDLQPGNSKRARATAGKAFVRFLQSEDVDLDFINGCIQRDATGQCFVSVMDKFALLSLLWYLFGRASDLTLVRKQNVSIDAGDVFFVHFIRMKTCEEQGLSTFPDSDFVTCPLYAIVLALITQTAPCPDLLDNLPTQVPSAAIALSPDAPLIDLLDHPGATAGLQAPIAIGNNTSPTIHSHVNRLLDRVAKRADVDEQLTSQSFRRGGAQHANGSERLTARWIFDRGAWNVSTTNKAFNYVFNALSKDHKVSKVLSGWKPTKHVPLADLKTFYAQTQEMIAEVQALLFATCHGLGALKYNVSQRVVDVLTAYLILHFPLLKEASPKEPAVKRLETCVLEADHTLVDLLAWSTHLAAGEQEEEDPSDNPSTKFEERRIIRHQASVIDHFFRHARRQDERMDALEAMLDNSRPIHKQSKRSGGETEISEPTKHRKQSSVAKLRAVWFEWYAQNPRLWSIQGEKQKKSDAKMLTAFLKLFFEAGFVLDDQAPTYRDDVMTLGLQAEANVLAFLGERGIHSKGTSDVLKQLRTLHRAGTLNDKIARYQRLLAAGAISDTEGSWLLERSPIPKAPGCWSDLRSCSCVYAEHTRVKGR